MTFRSNMALNITLLSFSTTTICQGHLIHIKAPLMFTFYFSCFTFPRYYCRVKLINTILILSSYRVAGRCVLVHYTLKALSQEAMRIRQQG